MRSGFLLGRRAHGHCAKGEICTGADCIAVPFNGDGNHFDSPPNNLAITRKFKNFKLGRIAESWLAIWVSSPLHETENMLHTSSAAYKRAIDAKYLVSNKHRHPGNTGIRRHTSAVCNDCGHSTSVN